MSQRCFALSPRALLLVLALAPSQVLADQSPQPRKTITLQTDLITPFFNALYLETNLRLSSHVGLLVNTSYLFVRDGDWKARTGTLGAGASYYFEGEAPGRWYAEAVGEANFSYWFHGPSGERAPLSIGATGVFVGGYRFICDYGPVLDVAAGLVVFHLGSARVETDAGSASRDGFTRLYPAAKLNVGWAF